MGPLDFIYFLIFTTLPLSHSGSPCIYVHVCSAPYITNGFFLFLECLAYSCPASFSASLSPVLHGIFPHCSLSWNPPSASRRWPRGPCSRWRAPPTRPSRPCGAGCSIGAYTVILIIGTSLFFFFTHLCTYETV
jgi:hypothetical protein